MAGIIKEREKGYSKLAFKILTWYISHWLETVLSYCTEESESRKALFSHELKKKTQLGKIQVINNLVIKDPMC